MMRITAFITLSILLLTQAPAFSNSMNFQTDKSQKKKQTSDQKAQSKVQEIDKACKLQAPQSAALLKTYKDYYSHKETLKGQKNILNKSVYSDKMDALKKQRDKSITSILTVEQQKKLEAYKAKQKTAKKDGKDSKDDNE